MSKKLIQFSLIGFVLPCIFFGCASFWAPSAPTGFETQRRIVRQGMLIVQRTSGAVAPIQAIYFGYDRNRDYAANNGAKPCKGVDLVEYKRLNSDGHWNYYPFLILSDENYDCYIDHGWLDCNHDGILETVVNFSAQPIKLEAVDQKHVGDFTNQCR